MLRPTDLHFSDEFGVGWIINDIFELRQRFVDSAVAAHQKVGPTNQADSTLWLVGDLVVMEPYDHVSQGKFIDGDFIRCITT